MNKYALFGLILFLRCNSISHCQVYTYEYKRNSYENASIQKCSMRIFFSPDSITSSSDCCNDNLFCNLEYFYSKSKDTVFINYKSLDGRLNIRPQYLLNRKKSIFNDFIHQESFSNGILGDASSIRYKGKTKISMFNGTRKSCYTFERIVRLRDHDTQTIFLLVETLFIDEDKLIPLRSKVKYLNPFTLKENEQFYQTLELISITE